MDRSFVLIQSLMKVVFLYYFYRILEIIETFQRDVQLPDRNFTVALRNLLLNVRVTTEKEEQNGVYFLPEADNQLSVDLLEKIYIVASTHQINANSKQQNSVSDQETLKVAR